MNIRTIAVLAGSAVLALSLSAPAAGQSGSETLRTPDGHPDISGVWDFRTVTPLERPEEFADQAFLSEEEVSRPTPPSASGRATPTATGRPGSSRRPPGER